MPSDQATMMRQLHDEQAPALGGYFPGSISRDPAEDLAKETLLHTWHHPSVLPEPDASVRAGCPPSPVTPSAMSGARNEPTLGSPSPRFRRVTGPMGRAAWASVLEGTVKSRTHSVLRAPAAGGG